MCGGNGEVEEQKVSEVKNREKNTEKSILVVYGTVRLILIYL